MEASIGGAVGGRQMAGFKDFYQFQAPTRVIAGRGLIEGTGFEFAKEGAARVLIVTDEVIHGTGLIERVRAGLEDGELEVAGVYDQVPPDSDSAVVKATAAAGHEHGADSILAVGGGSVMDTAKAANVIFTHGGEPREWEGYFGRRSPASPPPAGPAPRPRSPRSSRTARST